MELSLTTMKGFWRCNLAARFLLLVCWSSNVLGRIEKCSLLRRRIGYIISIYPPPSFCSTSVSVKSRVFLWLFSTSLDTCCRVASSVYDTARLSVRLGAIPAFVNLFPERQKTGFPCRARAAASRPKKQFLGAKKMCPSLGLWINCSFCVFLFYVHVNPTKQWGKNWSSDLAPICRGTVLTYSIWRMYTSDMFSELIFSFTIPKSSKRGGNCSSRPR